LYFSGTLNCVTGILDVLLFYECLDVPFGQWNLAIVVINVALSAVGKREGEGLLKSFDAGHGENYDREIAH
jgi:hypothetical protein